MTSNGAESGTEEDEEMAAEDDDSEGEDDLPMEMVEDAGRSNKVGTFISNYEVTGLSTIRLRRESYNMIIRLRDSAIKYIYSLFLFNLL